ncbi:hypothetical protein GCM10010399_81240 [Dactylosporangium fulvum]|uniref:Uncharacterized protein n=1 Tax=Dactylosporangium fulvum TaxID=53359 RepID=A0ABY5VU86_9ACTN|nr:hypothetical protein [Dactylosporangium fulvum]UWP79346.1 hypothetical protein Dfulv_29785 [Dactylosporangium fulvum]
MQADLERRYRRLLRAYPAAHRDEILTMLLDAAPPDRRRPTRGEVLDLLGGGLRQRFRLPLGWAPLAVAVLAVLIGGGLGSALGGWLARQTAAPLPSDAAARDIVAMVTGEPYRADFQREDSLLSRQPSLSTQTPLDDGSMMEAARRRLANVQGTRSPDDSRWSAEAARQRLAAHGWRMVGSDGNRLVAEREGIELTVFGAPASVGVGLAAVDPTAVPFATAAGWIAGATGGWLLVGWVWRRARRASAGRRLAFALGDGSSTIRFRWSPPLRPLILGLLAALGLGALIGPTAHTYFLLYRLITLGETYNPPWGAYAWDPVPTVTGLAAAVVATAVAARAAR